jgi:methylmalonyl-CoA mutase cobalamin-binding subunit
MPHDMQQVSVRRSEGAMGGVSQFAAEVVARLVARDGTADPELKEALICQFVDAVAGTDPAAFELLKPELKRARISSAQLADVYIPEVARRLGKAWDDDALSFAQVTMGASRLQAILREIGSAWIADGSGRPGGPTLLVILPSGEQHTLGAMVMAGRLRRSGISVCMRIAPNPAELAQLATMRAFDGALMSIASQDRLEVCQKLVTTLKDATRGRLKVAVGGSVLGEVDDILRATGADVVTNDIDHALRVIGVVQQDVAILGTV